MLVSASSAVLNLRSMTGSVWGALIISLLCLCTVSLVSSQTPIVPVIVSSSHIYADTSTNRVDLNSGNITLQWKNSRGVLAENDHIRLRFSDWLDEMYWITNTSATQCNFLNTTLAPFGAWTVWYASYFNFSALSVSYFSVWELNFVVLYILRRVLTKNTYRKIISTELRFFIWRNDALVPTVAPRTAEFPGIMTHLSLTLGLEYLLKNAHFPPPRAHVAHFFKLFQARARTEWHIHHGDEYDLCIFVPCKFHCLPHQHTKNLANRQHHGPAQTIRGEALRSCLMSMATKSRIPHQRRRSNINGIVPNWATPQIRLHCRIQDCKLHYGHSNHQRNTFLRNAKHKLEELR
jgi:hypothetical protein